MLAKRQNVPILPLVISGSKDALPKNSWNFHGKTHVVVTVLDEILPETFEDTSPRILANEVRDLIKEKLAQNS